MRRRLTRILDVAVLNGDEVVILGAFGCGRQGEGAMEVAVEQYGFCPDLDQNEDGSIGSLADVLWQSTVWYFWWD